MGGLPRTMAAIEAWGFDMIDGRHRSRGGRLGNLRRVQDLVTLKNAPVWLVSVGMAIIALLAVCCAANVLLPIVHR